ncbi:hypothetical protein GCM10009415_54320 [Chitinophaga japonensis]
MFPARTLGQAPPVFNCSTGKAYLLQGNPTVPYEVNLATGASSQVSGPLISGANASLNAIGYNPTDNYIWGKVEGTSQVVRIAGDWSVDVYTVPGLIANGINVGDVSSNGILYLFGNVNNNNTIQRVDVNPASPTYLQRLPNLTTTASDITDWAFSPVDGNLYALGNGGSYNLFRFDTATGARTVVGTVSGGGIQGANEAPYGAAYMDIDGNLYLSSNTTGRIFRIASPHTGGVTAVLMSQGPASDNNDGARCPAVVADVQTDLSIVKKGPATVMPGGVLSYQLLISNNGPAAVANVIVTDPAAPNFTATGVTCAAGSGAGGNAVCPSGLTVAALQGSGLLVPSLPAGASITLTVTGTAGDSGTITNEATVSASAAVNDSLLTNNLSTFTTVIRPPCTGTSSVYSFDPAATLSGAGTIGANGGTVDLVFTLSSGPAVPGLGASFTIPLTYSDFHQRFSGTDHTWRGFNNLGPASWDGVNSTTGFTIVPNVQSFYAALPASNTSQEPVVTPNTTDNFFTTYLADGTLDQLGTFDITIGTIPAAPNGMQVIADSIRIFSSNNLSTNGNGFDQGGWWLKPVAQHRVYTSSAASQTIPLSVPYGNTYTYRYSAFTEGTQLPGDAGRGVMLDMGDIVFCRDTLPTFACTESTGYLFQGIPTSAYQVNLTTGDTTLARSNLLNTPVNNEINGIGYNQADNKLWGMRMYTNQVARIHADWSVDTFAIAGLPTTPNLYVGDVSADGVLYLFSADGGTVNTIRRVDVNPSSPTYLQQLPALTTTPSDIYDWAFSPADSNLYALQSGTYQLYRFNPTTGARTTVGTVAGGGIQVDNGSNPFGAVYMDANGSLFVGNNATGKVYKIADPHLGNTTAEFVTNGPVSGSNDGARCPLTIIAVPPVAVNDTAVTDAGVPVIIPVLQNDSTSADGAPLDSGSVSITRQPQQGTVTVDAGGKLTYTPGAGYTGMDTLQYIVKDTAGLADTATVFIRVTPVQPVFDCISATGYLVRDNPADMYLVDISTGAVTLAKDNLLGGANAGMNAMGYNVTDNLLWAARNGTNQVVRIGSDWSVQAFAIAGLPASGNFNTGDIDSDGILYLYAGSPGTSTTIYRVDVNPASPGYLKALPPLTTTASTISDWSFSPVDSSLYAIDDYNWQLYRINPATGARTLVGAVSGGGIRGAQTFGSSYMDAAGDLYVTNNTTGNIYRIASPHTGGITAALISQSPAGGGDGARCPLAGLPPVAVNDTVTTDANKPVVIQVLYNDSTVAGGALLDSSSVTITAQPRNGTVTVDPATGQVTYTPALNFTGRDTLQYLVRDTAGIPDTAMVFIRIVAAQPPLNCNASVGFLIQENPTDLYLVNLSNGQYSMVKDNLLGTGANTAMNSMGYNVKDNHLWAVRSGTNQVVRIGSDWSVQTFAIAGLTGAYHNGDINTDGIMYFYAASTEIFRIDLNPASPNYLKALPPLTTVATAIADWAFSPIDGNLYGVEIVNAIPRLVRFNPNTGARTVVGDVAGGGIRAATGFGAVYMDVEGSLYLSDNASGSIFKIANPHNGNLTATFMASGPSSGNNDGARCPLTLVVSTPVAVNDSAATPVNVPVTLNILDNDSTATDAAPLDSSGTTVITQPLHGSITLDSSGNLTYTPDSAFVGLDSLQYVVSDTLGATDTATVYITTLADRDNDGVPDITDPDDDNDGIPDTVEQGPDPDNPRDTDGDGVPDHQDLDSDNDGVPDIIESGGSDPDGDGMGDPTDSDNDGVPDEFDPDQGGTPLTRPDTDGDGIPDYIDIDADNDGIVDNIESQSTDGYIPPSGSDTDGDGLDDAYDPTNGFGGPGLAPVNTDSTDTSDYLDLDTDNDGKPDIIEGWDTNGNGVIDGAEKQPDTTDVDNDGLLDGFDADTTVINPTNGTTPTSYPDMNNPGDDRDWRDPVPAKDTDGDGIPDITDPDDDNDGIPDTVEQGPDPDNPRDTDGDGVPDHQDLDSDNDGVPDIIEAGGSDPDGDGMGDPTDTDNDGVPDEFDPDQGGTPLTPPDTDGDGIPDYIDIDADNDGIVDNIESQSTDGYIPPTGTDTDGDGLDDAYDPTNGFGGPGLTPVNKDSSDVPDYLDLDTDNDGKPDIIEGWDINGNGVIDGAEKQPGTTDADNDGLLDGFDADTAAINPTNGTTPASYPDMNNPGNDRDWRDPVPAKDTDGDGVPDITDPDDDNDGIPDTVEQGPDPDNPRDTDGDGVPDHQDLDSDNDGVPDIIEAGGSDPDGDGMGDPTDTDNDGVPDEFDPDQGGTPLTPPDTDGDGIPDYIDIDADNDGIVDNIESQSTDGYIPPTGTDTDGDGLDDAYDPTNGFGGPGLTPVNKDSSDAPDYLDLDTDNDGKPDIIEGWDINGNGVIDGAEKQPGTTDADNDGLLDGYDNDPTTINPTNGTTPASYPDMNDPGNDRDWREPVSGPDNDNDGVPDDIDLDDDNDGIPDTTEIGPDPNNPVDTDGDGIPDYQDLDSDNDGVPDIIEAGGTDTNGDGLVDDPTDQDKNGVPDKYDPAQGGTPLTPLDTDGDGIPNAQDLDSDNDGIPDVVEAGGTDANNDGKPDGPFTDADKDGFNDAIDPVNNTPTGGTPLVITGPDNNADGKPDSYPAGDDQDRDGVPNLWDIDSDNDGITDVQEAGLPDTDNNGLADGADTDGNGWSDPVDNLPALTPPDTDGDGLPDYLDLDADNDGIVDNIEAQSTNGYLPPTGMDSDGDGLDNAYDPTNGPGGAGTTPVNTDGADTPDYLDLDTDNDGKPDRLEGWDTNGNGVIDGDEKQPGAADADNDGLLDGYDANPAAADPTNGTMPGSYPDVNNPGNDRDWRQPEAPVTDLAVTVTPQTTTIRTGDYVTYTVEVVNNGPDNATGVVVSNLLPPMLNAPRDILVASGAATYDPATHAIIWNVGPLALDERLVLTFTTRVLSNGSMTDSAVVRGNEQELVMDNNEDIAPVVTVEGEELFIPNTFTPNGDGRNDRFVIKGLSRYTNVRIEIYNRWGNQVYRSDNYSNDWDGAGLSQGIYYYVLKVRDAAGAEKEFQGWLQLLR